MTESKKQISAIVDDLRRVTKWGRMAAYAQANSLPVTRTWDPFLKAILEANTSEAALEKVLAKLRTFYVSQILAGDRIVTLFRPHATLGGLLFKLATAAASPDVPVAKGFPALIPEADAKEVVPTVPTFVGKLTSKDGRVALFFLSGRYVEERDKYRADEVAPAVRNAFQDYDEFIAIKLRFRQCMDSIVVSPDGSAEMRLDLPTLTNADYAGVCANTLLQHFHAQFSGPAGEPLLGERRNLFKAIDSIYRATGLGRVCELGFETPTDSVKVEKMRGRTADLREELYHKSGKAGLGDLADIIPYRLSVRFPSTVKGSAFEVALPGSFRELSKPTPRLEIAAVSGCLSTADFHGAVKTLLAHA